MSVIEQEMYFSCSWTFINYVVAAFYYLRIIKIIYFDETKVDFENDHHLGLKISLLFQQY